MAKYISLLRGINVSGKNKINMEELRKLYENIGFTDVSSYIQSGNLIFTTPQKSITGLTKIIEQAISKKFGLNITVFLKSEKTWNSIIQNNPYSEKIDREIAKLHVTFLLKKPLMDATRLLNSIVSGKDKFSLSNDIIYLYCPNGYGRTKFTNNYLEKLLNVAATTRNLKTVFALYDKLSINNK